MQNVERNFANYRRSSTLVEGDPEARLGRNPSTVSAEYLPLYLAEFEFRYNNRLNTDIFGAAIIGLLRAIPRLWRVKRRALRRAALNALGLAPIFALFVAVGLWAVFEPPPSQVHSSDITCAYAQQGQRGPQRSGAQLLRCKQTKTGSTEPDAYRLAKEGHPEAFLPAFRHWLASIIGEPTAAFTFVLALSTIGLWLSTRGLLRGANRQSAWLGKQTEILSVQKELVRLQFLATHRPQIKVHAVEYISVPSGAGDGRDEVGASILCFNIGTSKAKDIEIRGDILVSHEKIAVDVKRQIIERVKSLDGGVKLRVSIVSDRTLNDLPRDNTPIRCIGTISYCDTGDIRRETGFCFQMTWTDPPRWISANSPEHEYEY